MRLTFIQGCLALVLVAFFGGPALAQHCDCFEGICVVVKQMPSTEAIEVIKDLGKVSTLDKDAPELGHNLPHLYEICAKKVERLLRSERLDPTPEQIQLFSPPNFITVVNVESLETGALPRMATRENSCRQTCP
jgi:hypothetical protein